MKTLKDLGLSERGQKLIQNNLRDSIPTTNKMLDSMLILLSEIDDALVDYDFESSFVHLNIKPVNIRQCTTQLLKDGYVGQINGRDIQLATHSFKIGEVSGQIKKAQDAIPSYYITFEGRRFIKNGGYESTVLKFKIWCRKNWFSMLSLIIGFAGVIVAIYSQVNNKRLDSLTKKADFSTKLINNMQSKIDSIDIATRTNYYSWAKIKNDIDGRIDSISFELNSNKSYIIDKK